MKQNLLVLMVDQLRFDALGFTGCPWASTPNLDRLAAESVSFDAAYTVLPSCCPARQSFLTGQRPEQLGCHWNYDITLKVPSLTPETFTWPQALHEAGYRTGYVGKWHVSQTHTPLDFGYDELYSDGEYYEQCRRRFPEVKYAEPFLGEPDPLPLEETCTHFLAHKAADMMTRFAKEGKPWHLFFSLSEPHLPCRPAKPFAGRVDPAQLPPWGSFAEDFHNKPYIQAQMPISWGLDEMTWEDWAPVVARYHEALSQVDDAMGMVLDTLKALGLEENTTILFTTDHGDMGGSHRMIDKHYVLYDDIVHVPMLLKAPGRTEAGRTRRGFTCHTLDWMPTVLEWADLPVPEDLPGQSLWPLAAGEPQPGRDRVIASGNGQQFGLYCSRMLRTELYKYIWNLTDVDELYDLKADPWEMENRVDDPALAETLAALRRTLYEDLTRARDPLASFWNSRQLLEGKKLGPADRKRM